jgi:hypothetical protein
MEKPHLVLLVIGLLSSGGCREPDVVHQYVPLAPDIAVYGGVFFESMDGLHRYDDANIIPRLSTSVVKLRMPDGTPINPTDLSQDVLDQHRTEYRVAGNDGQGNFTLIGDGFQVVFASNRVTRIALYDLHTLSESNPFAIEIQGQRIVVPIERAELEKLIGEPDEIRLDSYSPAE